MGDVIPFPDAKERNIRQMKKLGMTEREIEEALYWEAFFEEWEEEDESNKNEQL
jgi:hypothetical protein